MKTFTKPLHYGRRGGAILELGRRKGGTGMKRDTCPPCAEGVEHLWVYEDEDENEYGYGVVHSCVLCGLVRREDTLWGGRPVVSFEREE